MWMLIRSRSLADSAPIPGMRVTERSSDVSGRSLRLGGADDCDVAHTNAYGDVAASFALRSGLVTTLADRAIAAARTAAVASGTNAPVTSRPL